MKTLWPYVAVAALSFAACGRDTPRMSSGSVTTSPASVTASPVRSSSTPSPSATAGPEWFAGVRDRVLVVASARDGRVLRTLFRPRAGEGVDSVDVGPDGTIWFAVMNGAGGRVLRTSYAGRPAEVTAGCAVAVSPDGRRLAIVGGRDQCGRNLVVRDVASGASRSWDTSAKADTMFGSPEWTADSAAVLLVRNEPEEPGDVVRFVPGRDANPLSATVLGPRGRLPAGTGWYVPTASARGRAYVMRNCCALDANTYAGDRFLLVVDDRTGAVRSSARLAQHAASLDVDATGQHLLLSDWDAAVWRRTGNGEFARVTTGMFHVSW